MMKKIVWILLPILIISLSVLSVSASDQYVYDNAELLTEEEEDYLNQLAGTESEKYGISIVILTENGIGNTDPMLYAADFYDYGEFDTDGVIMFLDMGERDWRIVNSGSLMDIIGDYEIDYIGEYAVPWFSDGDYKTGFEQYLVIVSALCDKAANGSFTGDYVLYDYHPERYDLPATEDYDPDRMPEYVYDLGDDLYYESSGVGGMYYLIAAIAAVVIAFVVCHCFKSQLNTAVPKNNASGYFSEDDTVMTVSKDKFLYSHVTKIKRETNDDRPSGGGHKSSGGGVHSFSGSSGRSHSGGGGKF